ncbi:60S ribosomal protein l21-1 [Phtheirospermum japonicum]|uniref:60S ribosomal protein l21-1 n=1 Tax=Phtheirospermum japonicum TaxID=374723 RepID=A0A830CRQ5_9LAMI|nr:60S ribosomal protein l21-1 [Phtheirospermum japonicum]
MLAGHELRSRTRDLFARPFRKKGPTHLTTYLHIFKIGDYVDVKVKGSIYKGMHHKFYHGRTGRVWNAPSALLVLRSISRLVTES